MVGKVQYINKEKAYGFIETEEFPKAVFFHIKDFSGSFDSLEKGDEVYFEPERTERGIKALDVMLARM